MTRIRNFLAVIKFRYQLHRYDPVITFVVWEDAGIAATHAEWEIIFDGIVEGEQEIARGEWWTLDEVLRDDNGDGSVNA